MSVRSACSVNRKIVFLLLMTLLSGTIFLNMRAFGEDLGACIEGDCSNGHGTRTWLDGRKYVGEWKDDMHCGHGTHTWPNGEIYKGEWKDDSRHGAGTCQSVARNLE